MYNPDGTRYDMMGNGGGWMIGFAVLTLVLLTVAMVAVLANLFLHVSHKPLSAGGPHAHETTAGLPVARVVLDERLVRGEITPEDYRTLRTALEE